MRIDIGQREFGTLCICALRYCHGRKTYMPSLVQQIVGGHLREISRSDLQVMLDDCDFQRRMCLYGDEKIDKPDWLRWEQKVKNEIERRRRRDEWWK